MKLLTIITILAVTTCIFFYSCSKESAALASTSTGKGGSLTRFTIAGDHLYAVDNHFLYAYSLTNAAKPVLVYTSPLNYDIETIYPYNKFLFLGTKTGLYIYSIDTASRPRLVGEAKHARSCDPVVANDSVAFVTLKNEGNCGPATAGLYIHNIKNIMQPSIEKIVELPNPVGLGLSDSILYVCCGNAGLKVFNVSNPYSPSLRGTITGGNFIDVIPYNGVLICFVQDGIMLYDITSPGSPVYIKKIAD